MPRLRRPLTLALPLVLTLLAAPLAAQEAPLALTVRGVSGSTLRARPRRFVAVDVLLENVSARDQEGVLRVYRSEAPRVSTPDQALYYERRVSVPRQGRRAETLYYYVQEGEPPDRLCVAFEPDEGPAPQPAFPQVRVAAGRELAVLVLSSRPAVADQTARLFQRSAVPCAGDLLPTRVEQALLEALPDHMAGYGPYDAVVVADLDPDDLPEAVATPLLEWTAAGGDLIVIGSGGRARVPPALAAALPVELTGQVAERSLAPLRALAPHQPAPSATPVLVDRARARPDTAVLAADRGEPLVVRGRHGAGWVTYLAFPADAAPVARWVALQSGDLGAALLRPSREDPEAGSDAPPSPPLEELLLNLSEALEPLEPPSTWLVAPLLLLYVALVSPLNYLALSRRRRLGLAQAIGAGIALVFALAFWGIGFLFKGSQALSTRVALAEVPVASAGHGRLDVISGYYSTGQGLTEGEGPPGAMVGPVAGRRVGQSAEGRIQQGGERVLLDAVTLHTWGLRRFRSLRAADVGRIDATFTLAGGALAGELHNGTPYALRDPVLLLPHGRVELGDLAPGARLTFDAAAVRGRGPHGLEPFDLTEALLSAARGSYPPLYGKPTFALAGLQDPYAADPRRRITDALTRRLARVPRWPGRLPALLVARATADPGGVDLSELSKRDLELIVVTSELHVELAPGKHTLSNLPPAVAARAAGERTANYLPVQGGTGTFPALQGSGGIPGREGFVIWTWNLPGASDAPLAVDQLRLDWRFEPRPRVRGQLVLEAYSYRRGAWIPLGDLADIEADDGDGNAHWPANRRDPLVRDLVDPATGQVLVRLFNKGSDVTIEAMNLTVTFTRQ